MVQLSRASEQIRLVIGNVGTEAHEFLLATTAEKLERRGNEKNPGMEHDEPKPAPRPQEI